MTIYSNKMVENLLNRYSERNNFTVYHVGGCLVDNLIICADGCKTTIVKEVYLNEWSSGCTIRMYNKIPAKYQKVIDLLNDDEEEKALKLFFAA